MRPMNPMASHNHVEGLINHARTDSQLGSGIIGFGTIGGAGGIPATT